VLREAGRQASFLQTPAEGHTHFDQRRLFVTQPEEILDRSDSPASLLQPVSLRVLHW
jgi:hypothetical protein